MVKIIKRKDENVYECEECGFFYKEKQWSQKCEEWCKTHHSCNVSVIAHAVRR